MTRFCRRCRKNKECAKHRQVCKDCDYKRTSLWAKQNRAKINARQNLWKAENLLRVLESRLRCEYVFTEYIIKRILSWKGSKCICGKKLVKLGRGWNDGRIEHNHETGKFRGIVCGRCNYVLGAIEESQKLLTAMKKYLKRGLS